MNPDSIRTVIDTIWVATRAERSHQAVSQDLLRSYLQAGGTLLQLSVTLILAIVTYRIQKRQKQVSESAVRVALFDRRYAVYEATAQWMRDICNEAQPAEAVHLSGLYLATKQAEFLFNKPLAEYLDRIQEEGLKLNSLRLHRDDFPRDPLAADAHRQALKSFMSELERLRDVFSPHLGIGWI